MEDGNIMDYQITASSEWPGFPAQNGRLNDDGAWGTRQQRPWLQVCVARVTVKPT